MQHNCRKIEERFFTERSTTCDTYVCQEVDVHQKRPPRYANMNRENYYSLALFLHISEHFSPFRTKTHNKMSPTLSAENPICSVLFVRSMAKTKKQI